MERELRIFNDYINNYDLTIPALKRKVDHTYRVMDYANDIALSLDLKKDDLNITKICALFHDIGRFPQYEKYNTFDDDKSFDHGDKSEEVLKSISYNNNIVLNAVKYHNKYSVPDKLSEKEKIFCNITRDADKIDIIFTQFKDKYSDDFKINDETLNYFKERKLIPNNYSDHKSIIILRQLAFIFDLNFNKSLEIIRDSNIINEMVNLFYEATKDKNIYLVENLVNSYINERID